MDFLQLEGKWILVAGVANRRSIAWHVAQGLREAGAHVLYLFRNQELLEKNRSLIGPEALAFPCDLEHPEELPAMAQWVAGHTSRLDGILHSVAFANYSQGLLPFHQIPREDFLQALDISCLSLPRMCHALQALLAPDASIVTMSISSTRMAAESYGYMGPVKAALDSTVVFLAKSLTHSLSPEIRVNAVGAAPLKTSASAGIPGYVDAYLFAEKATMRHRALETREAADTALFLLSPRASGINAQTLVVDAGMGANFFDDTILHPGE